MNKEQLLEYYQKNPIEFFVKCLDVDRAHVWDKMEDVANSVRDNQNTVVKAGNAVSKTYTMARVAIWFVYCFYPATVITTAPSNIQVEELLWREIGEAHTNAKVPLGGKLTNTMLDLSRGHKSKKWFAFGFATKPDTVTQQATRMQGFHNENVLVIFDEAAGIMSEIWEAKDKLITNPKHKFCAIGNPTTAHGRFTDCFKSSMFKTITISVKDTPNYKTGNQIIPGLSGREFEQHVIKVYGLESNAYKAMITGEIPDEDVDSLIPISWIEKAEIRLPYPHYRFKKRFVVVDVADGGDDETVIKGFENKDQIDELILREKKVEECEPYVWRMLRKIGGNAIVYDHDGVGRVMGGLLRGSTDKKTIIIAFEGSAPAYDLKTFFNRRAEGHWAMRNDFKDNIISFPPDDMQREEIAAIKYSTESRSRTIAIEKKKFIKERIGRSPDRSDTVMMMSACFEEIPIWEKKYDDSGVSSYKSRQRQGTAMSA